jgi:hypothetical protein
MRLDAVGSWEGGKRCSTNEFLCMDIPIGTYPKGACPIGNMDMAGNTVLYCTYCTYCYPQRSARIKLG